MLLVFPIHISSCRRQNSTIRVANLQCRPNHCRHRVRMACINERFLVIASTRRLHEIGTPDEQPIPRYPGVFLGCRQVRGQCVGSIQRHGLQTLNIPTGSRGQPVPSPTMRQGYHILRLSAVVPLTTDSRKGRLAGCKTVGLTPRFLSYSAGLPSELPTLIGRVRLTGLKAAHNPCIQGLANLGRADIEGLKSNFVTNAWPVIPESS